MHSGGQVVVGVDGSAGALAAAAWAVEEAELRHAEQVRVVVVTGDRSADDEAWETARSVASRSTPRRSGPEVTATVAHGDPADVLVQLSGAGELVVVGSRGRGPLAATLLGSVSAKVATHARCPVVVVREHRSSGPVVVGVDNSSGSRAALRYALEAAARYECELLAVQVWEYVEPTPIVPPLEHELVELRDEALRGLSEQLSGCAEAYPNVPVRRIAQRGHPVAELAAAAEEARLLVVGHRGRGGFAGLLLGSVAAGVLHHAPCPVAIVRDAVAES
ncbi:Nucleotide-binding universal stress protein, UspA family [Saccharopolyspora kobensis]|uniref:Nucleotide-binding universal stress protein, UspA family n=1 Tax=Saccharopolyspora kobensis TaxID=146035 RepID=A0A1H5V780_9PSEU|nr:universal stress protein [Saccharopolyspora kobensis]SEF83225.1 Nucleotide-binding universal stress protein, UspA family [Saccharopolyspora kobensis]SFC64275.1 Nucleotide-binding universal stress protein, UspA family [Saccharopolyspora kobensis]